MFQGSHVTSDAGLILVRELDERLSWKAITAEYLRDSRHGPNTQFPLPDLLRQSNYSRLASSVSNQWNVDVRAALRAHRVGAQV
ncbi:MAG TPA: transposase [Vicinamibacterales bacterium]|nr:transposase [Vicinamibacterales bacterium]